MISMLIVIHTNPDSCRNRIAAMAWTPLPGVLAAHQNQRLNTRF